MKTKLAIVIAIIISLTSISYGSLNKPETREEFEQKVRQQQAKIEELETMVSEQEKQILDLKWQIYHLKHKSESNKSNKSEPLESKKLQTVTKDQKAEIARLKELCLKARIDPNSDPNQIVKLRTEEEEKEYQQKLANYEGHFKKKRQKPMLARSPTAVPSVSEKNVAENRPIGISYYQVMEYLSDFFLMEKSTPVDGQDRYMGQTADNLAILEIIGNKDNISQATIMIGIPNDAPDKLVRNTILAIRFLENTVPEWTNSNEWITANAKRVADIPGVSDVKVVKGNKLITMMFLKTFGMVSLTVKHK
ncbi:hypothetical protein ES703_78382 [subsurface metagenome]